MQADAYLYSMIKTVCVAGSGTMGSGIALACAQAGFTTILFDIEVSFLDKAKQSISSNLDFLEKKGKIDAAVRAAIESRITYTHDKSHCVADLIIEAIIEKLEIKQALFSELAAINSQQTIFASNTSSLSISAIQLEVSQPERVAGLHFFNPAHVMKLVEVVKGNKTSDDVIETLVGFCRSLEKTPVICTDAPGFIVNRVARHYYLESMRIAEKGDVDLDCIDTALEAAGFKMGPFRLMDMIGMDINLAVTRSLYEAFDNAPRFLPSPLQVDKVEKGELGRKSGKGFYAY